MPLANDQPPLKSLAATLNSAAYLTKLPANVPKFLPPSVNFPTALINGVTKSTNLSSESKTPFKKSLALNLSKDVPKTLSSLSSVPDNLSETRGTASEKSLMILISPSVNLAIGPLSFKSPIIPTVKDSFKFSRAELSVLVCCAIFWKVSWFPIAEIACLKSPMVIMPSLRFSLFSSSPLLFKNQSRIDLDALAPIALRICLQSPL